MSIAYQEREIQPVSSLERGSGSSHERSVSWPAFRRRSSTWTDSQNSG
jgi:hypothetical protein